MKIALVVKSLGTQCGIANYSSILSKHLNADIVSSASELKKKYDKILIAFDTNFYLFEDDFSNELSECYKKSEEVIFDLHTVLRGLLINTFPYRKLVKSPFSLNRTTNATYIPHFIYPANNTGKLPPSKLKIGTFGFASPARRMKELLSWGRDNEIDVKIIATINTSGITTEKSTRNYAEEISEEFPGQVDIGYFTHDEIVSKLEDCSHLIFCRNGDPTIGVSGAVPLAYNAKRPIIVEHKALAPELKDIYVSRLESLNKDKIDKITKIPTGGISVEDTTKTILNFLNNNKIKSKPNIEQLDLYES